MFRSLIMLLVFFLYQLFMIFYSKWIDLRKMTVFVTKLLLIFYSILTFFSIFSITIHNLFYKFQTKEGWRFSFLNNTWNRKKTKNNRNEVLEQVGTICLRLKQHSVVNENEMLWYVLLWNLFVIIIKYSALRTSSEKITAIYFPWYRTKAYHEI